MFQRKRKEEKSSLVKTFSDLLSSVKEDFTQILRVNLNMEPFSARERLKRIQKREEIRRALRMSGSGDEASKIFVKDYIGRLLTGKYKLNEESISDFIEENTEYKFKLMLREYVKTYDKDGLERLIEEKFSFVIRENERTIRDADIEKAFSAFRYRELGFPEKLEYLCQRIYEKYKGNGVIDELLHLNIDGISGGVSGGVGNPEVWIMYKGNTVRLEFLKYDGEREIKRICRNLCKSYGAGQLSERKGFLVAELSDGSRASISRPPFCETWSFFIRKFRVGKCLEMEEIVQGEQAEKIIRLLKYLVKGERLLAITGEQDSGKTTMLAAIIGFIPKRLNIRVEEMSFELHLRKRFPDRNIVSFKETECIGIQDGLDFTKKTDGNVTILGEVASMQMVVFLVQLAQNASSFTIFTHHAKDTDSLIAYLRNSLLMQGNFRNEKAALEQAVRAVRFNIRIAKDADGKRGIDKISEIVPVPGEEAYMENVILVRKNGGYQFKNELTRETREEIFRRLSPQEEGEYIAFLKDWGKGEYGKTTVCGLQAFE